MQSRYVDKPKLHSKVLVRTFLQCFENNCKYIHKNYKTANIHDHAHLHVYVYPVLFSDSFVQFYGHRLTIFGRHLGY